MESEIEPFEFQKHLKFRLFEGWISNVPVSKCSGLSYGYSYSPNHSKNRPLEIRTFLFRFLMVFDKICLDFKWLGFRILDPSQILFATQPVFAQSKSRLVRISDPHCITIQWGS